MLRSQCDLNPIIPLIFSFIKKKQSPKPLSRLCLNQTGDYQYTHVNLDLLIIMSGEQPINDATATGSRRRVCFVLRGGFYNTTSC